MTPEWAVTVVWCWLCLRMTWAIELAIINSHILLLGVLLNPFWPYFKASHCVNTVQHCEWRWQLTFMLPQQQSWAFSFWSGCSILKALCRHCTCSIYCIRFSRCCLGVFFLLIVAVWLIPLQIKSNSECKDKGADQPPEFLNVGDAYDRDVESKRAYGGQKILSSGHFDIRSILQVYLAVSENECIDYYTDTLWLMLMYSYW